jgi:hypothetical protein
MLSLVSPVAEPIGRAKWWGFQFLILFVGILALFVLAINYSDTGATGRVPEENAMVWGIIGLVLYTNLCTCLARLRDTGRSGWWWIAFLLPTVGTGLMIYFCGVEAGQKRDFDPDQFERQIKQDFKPKQPTATMTPGAARVAEATSPRPPSNSPGSRPAFGRR